MPPTPLGYSLLALNHERLTRWLAPARLRTAHVTGCGTELLQGIIRHAAEPCTQLLVFYIGDFDPSGVGIQSNAKNVAN